MRTIQKTILTDAAMQPIAVQIPYSDWLEIERQLELTGGSGKTVDPSRFSGVITLTEDPLEYQTRIRGVS